MSATVFPRYSSEAHHALADGTGTLVGERVVIGTQEEVDWVMVDVAAAEDTV